VNSFEQLCINYANEKLQLHFNDVIFSIEREMYLSEGISMKQVAFKDNSMCVSLIEGKPYTHINTHSLTHTQTHSHTHSYTHTRKISLSHTHSHTHTQASRTGCCPCWRRSTHAHTHAQTPTHTHSCTDTHIHSCNHTHTHAQTHTHSLSLTHTHTKVSRTGCCPCWRRSARWATMPPTCHT
jgi:hypothetical protein